MFGFGSSPDHFAHLLEFSIENWSMRPKYASAFLTAYRKPISKVHEQHIKRFDQLREHGSSEQRFYALTNDPESFTLVAQAYTAYMSDLRGWRGATPDVELAIWGILTARNDLLESLDRALARFIANKHEARFPTLLNDVFDVDDG